MNDGYQMLAEFYRLKQGGMGPLRSWLDRNWKVAEERVCPSTPHWISSFAPTPWLAPSFSLDSACPTPTSGCCCTAFGRPGKDQVTAIIARDRLCSCRHRTPCRRRCSRDGE